MGEPMGGFLERWERALTEQTPRRGRKRQSILDGALRVFARVGYHGASIDLIAAEAEVSTRTIYNHFENKEELFATVLSESSTRVAAAREELIERHLGEVADLEAALVALAQEWVRPDPEFDDHFRIVRRLRAESDRFPAAVIERWRRAGPLRVRRALATRLADLAECGVLVVGDPDLAAQQFVAVIADTTAGSADSLATKRESEIARAGVHTFLYGYLPRKS